MKVKRMSFYSALDMVIRPLYTFSVSQLKSMGIIDIELNDENYSMSYLEWLTENEVIEKCLNIRHIIEMGYNYDMDNVHVFLMSILYGKKDFETFKDYSGLDIFASIKGINDEIKNNPEQSKLLGFEAPISIEYYTIRLYKDNKYEESFCSIFPIRLDEVNFRDWDFDGESHEYKALVSARRTTDMDKLRRAIYRNQDVDLMENTINHFIKETRRRELDS